MARQAWLRSTLLDAAHRHANATQRRAVEGNLGGFCVCKMCGLKRPGADGVPRLLVSEPVGSPGMVGRPRVLALGYEPGRLSRAWASAAAWARAAYCGRPLPASRVAQPWFSGVPAWVVAIGSCIVCGDAGRGIKPQGSLQVSNRGPPGRIVPRPLLMQPTCRTSRHVRQVANSRHGPRYSSQKKEPPEGGLSVQT